MTSIFQTLDPRIHPEIDSEGLIRELLDRDAKANPDYPNVTVRSEIDLDVNTLADSILIVYDVGNATDLGHGAWRFPVSLSVFSSDPDKGVAFKSWLYERVMLWPFASPHPAAGAVNSVTPTGFKRAGPDSWNLARDVHVWNMDDAIIRAHS